MTDGPSRWYLARAASPLDLIAAREQLAFSLGWHVVLACLGVGLPGLTWYLHWRGIRTGDETYTLLAHQRARAMGVLFAIGAVSGTILSFEVGLLWPGLMGMYGQVIRLPFALEGPWRAMFSPATVPQTIHMILARRYVLVRTTAAVAVAAVLCEWALAQYPHMLPPDVDYAEAAATAPVLSATLILVAIGSLLLLPSPGWLYLLFQRNQPSAPAR
jgi:cytochrome bd-type quinol oxidase subunit 1